MLIFPILQRHVPQPRRSYDGWSHVRQDGPYRDERTSPPSAVFRDEWTLGTADGEEP